MCELNSARKVEPFQETLSLVGTPLVVYQPILFGLVRNGEEAGSDGEAGGRVHWQPIGGKQDSKIPIEQSFDKTHFIFFLERVATLGQIRPVLRWQADTFVPVLEYVFLAPLRVRLGSITHPCFGRAILSGLTGRADTTLGSRRGARASLTERLETCT